MYCMHHVLGLGPTGASAPLLLQQVPTTTRALLALSLHQPLLLAMGPCLRLLLPLTSCRGTTPGACYEALFAYCFGRTVLTPAACGDSLLLHSIPCLVHQFRADPCLSNTYLDRCVVGQPVECLPWISAAARNTVLTPAGTTPVGGSLPCLAAGRCCIRVLVTNACCCNKFRHN